MKIVFVSAESKMRANKGNGTIAFVSKAFTGRTSDKFIMNHCQLMDLLTPGDQVMADRGFSITDEMLLRSIDLNVPPAGTGVIQFTSEQVYKTKQKSQCKDFC